MSIDSDLSLFRILMEATICMECSVSIVSSGRQSKELFIPLPPPRHTPPLLHHIPPQRHHRQPLPHPLESLGLPPSCRDGRRTTLATFPSTFVPTTRRERFRLLLRRASFCRRRYGCLSSFRILRTCEFWEGGSHRRPRGQDPF